MRSKCPQREKTGTLRPQVLDEVTAINMFLFYQAIVLPNIITFERV